MGKQKKAINVLKFREKNRDWKKYKVWRRNVGRRGCMKCKLIKERNALRNGFEHTRCPGNTIFVIFPTKEKCIPLCIFIAYIDPTIKLQDLYKCTI